MAKYVPDVHTRRWIVIAPKRKSRPDLYKEKENGNGVKCPFCEGNEKMTPPETFRIGHGNPDEPGWDVRVVPNLYPITDVHEVVIHSPDHNLDIEDLSDEQNIKIFTVFKERFNYYRKAGQVLIFTNHGKSTGASQIHPHSQIVVVPHQIKLDTLALEPVRNVVFEGLHCVAYCPEFSQWPYETWVAPKKTGTFFGDIEPPELECLAKSVKIALNKIRKKFSDAQLTKQTQSEEFTYNIYIYPLQGWYLRIIPRLVIRAGFELGTGIHLNIVDPVDAALELAAIQ
jgi:UDPglucose--hexose-1-phosphate uridylyltransferase